MGFEMITVLRKQKNMSIKEMSEKSGIPLGTLSKISAGITKEPKLDTLKSIARILECNLDDLVDNDFIHLNHLNTTEYEQVKKYQYVSEHSPKGKEVIDLVLEREYQMAKLLRDQAKQKKVMEEQADTKMNLVRPITYYHKLASAGTGEYLFDDLVEGRITVLSTKESRGADFAIGVSGDSMEPEYKDGDVVLVKKLSSLKIGDVGIFTLNGESFIKKFEREGLVSLNPKYDVIAVNNTESFRCVGKVIGKAELL